MAAGADPDEILHGFGVVTMKKLLVGKVSSAKRQKSLRVEIARSARHARYGKIVHRTSVCQVHDESGAAKAGDLVEIIECPPRSKTKRWELVRIVKSAADVGV